MEKNLLLGLTQPRSDHSINLNGFGDDKTGNNRIIKKALRALDYFLLSVPKDSNRRISIIKELIRDVYRNEEKRILVLTSSIQGLDEICEIIDNSIINFEDINDGKINPGITMRNFIRIGIEDSTIQKYKHNLIGNYLGNVKSENEKVNLLNKHRIYVSTLNAIITEKHQLLTINPNIILCLEANSMNNKEIISLIEDSQKIIMLDQMISLRNTLYKKWSYLIYIFFRRIKSLFTKKKGIAVDYMIQKDFEAGQISLYAYLFNQCLLNEWTNAYDITNT